MTRTRATILILPILAAFSCDQAAADSQDAVWSFEGRGAGWKVRSADLEFGTSFRRDNLDWNIASDQTGLTSPNIVSELTWRNLQAFQFEARSHVETQNNLYVKLMFGYGWIVAGKNQDSDYGTNDRGSEWSRSNNSANRGEMMDVSLGVGYDFKLLGDSVSLIPLMGVAYDLQRLSITNGNQTLSGCAPSPPFPPATCGGPLGPFDGLGSSFRAEWLGPWNGLDFNFSKGRMRFGLGTEYHWNVTYHADANWNLRTDFMHPDSFDQTSTGQGYVVRGNVGYQWSERWTWIARAQWQKWWTGPGTVSFNSTTGPSTQRLNRVNWDSIGASLGAAYRF